MSQTGCEPAQHCGMKCSDKQLLQSNFSLQGVVHLSTYLAGEMALGVSHAGRHIGGVGVDGGSAQAAKHGQRAAGDAEHEAHRHAWAANAVIQVQHAAAHMRQRPDRVGQRLRVKLCLVGLQPRAHLLDDEHDDVHQRHGHLGVGPQQVGQALRSGQTKRGSDMLFC